MADINIGMWAKDRETLDQVLAQFGLLDHDQLQLSGAGYAGWSGVIVENTGEGEKATSTVRPGVYVNARALDLPREQTGKKSLARNLRHRVVGRSEIKIEQVGEDGERKPLLERTRLADSAQLAGGQVVTTVGVPFDPAMPYRIEIRQADELVFAAYSMEPDDPNAPKTPACYWA